MTSTNDYHRFNCSNSSADVVTAAAAIADRDNNGNAANDEHAPTEDWGAKTAARRLRLILANR